MRIYSQGAGSGGSMHGKITEETSRGGGFLLNWPTRILAKGRSKICTAKVRDEETDQMSGMIRYQGWGDS